jgi:hypothetical protein
MRPECSAFKRNREGAKGAHHARSETYRFPLSAFRSPLLPGLSLTCRVSIRECSALFILHSALPLRVVRAPGGAHRGWDPGRVFSVRAPGFAHQEQVQSGGIYQRSAVSRKVAYRNGAKSAKERTLVSDADFQFPTSDSGQRLKLSEADG